MPYSMPINNPVYVYVDWDGNGNFGSITGEDVTADVMPGVSAEVGRDTGRVTGGPQVNRASWTLLNESRAYGAEYSGSPLHGLVVPGRLCTIGRYYGDLSVTMNDPVATMNDPEVLMGGVVSRPIFTGRTEEPKETWGWGRRFVGFSAYGTIQRLIDTRITIPYAPTTRTGVAVTVILAAAGLTGAAVDIDGSSVVSGREILHWYEDNESVWDALRRMWATEGPPAALYESNDGVIHWEGRDYRATSARSMFVQASFSDVDPIYYYTDLEYEPSYGSVVNDMTMDIERFTMAAAASKIWEYDAPIVLGASATTTLTARLQDPILAPINPTLTTDYTLGAGTLTVATVTLISPLAALITLTAGAGGATVNPPAGGQGIQLRAYPLNLVSTVNVEGTIDPSDSQDAWGLRAPPSEIRSSIWPTISPAEAAGLIDGYLANYAEPRAMIRMTLIGGNSYLLGQILTRKVSDRIHIYDFFSGLDLDVTIEKITHTVDSLNVHKAVFHCERLVELNWARWDIDVWDSPTKFWGQ